MKRLGWGKERGIKHLIEKYNQKSRRNLTDEQLLEFWNYLKNLERKKSS
ncbi:hypothetical protein H1P_5840003 [Hyella patelloides LEGE 07179]|uniref:Uncharacterized protein n=1 Tax=Hyella patelloides LEGE 07179 TaxID=945734 RepID=A0A563W0Z2_9CYAN|nr:hypothetical protein H1P_5840003 [Hyella patelloides LEGE 07179]